MSIIKLVDPFGKDGGLIGARYVETGSPPLVGLILLGTVRVDDLIVFNAALQFLDLGPVLIHFSIVGILGLMDSANSSAQYSMESGGIKVRNISKEGIQRTRGDRDQRRGWRPGNLAIVFAAEVSGSLCRHNGRIVLADGNGGERRCGS